MTVLNTSKLDGRTIAALANGGWTGNDLSQSKFHVELLKCAGFPVGERGKKILAELGGITILQDISRSMKFEPQTTTRGGIREWLSVFLGFSQPRLKAFKEELIVETISFSAPSIIDQCANPDLCLVDLPSLFGKVMSVVAVEPQSSIIVVDETSPAAYIADGESSEVLVCDDFEQALESMMLIRPWPSHRIPFTDGLDDFHIEETFLESFIGASTRSFRFRVHRNASCFNQKWTLDIVIRPDGIVQGTAKDNRSAQPFVWINTKVSESIVIAMQSAWLQAGRPDLKSNMWYKERWGVESWGIDSAFVIRYYDLFDWEITNRRLRRRLDGSQDASCAEVWDACIAICDECLKCVEAAHD